MSTDTWANRIHKTILGHTVPSEEPHPFLSPSIDSGTNFKNVAVDFKGITDVMEKDMAFKIKNQQVKDDEKDIKCFTDLPKRGNQFYTCVNFN